MDAQNKIMSAAPLFVPHSHLTTESNKTGSWRFLKPCYDEKTSPCSAACPAGEDIGRIEMLATQGLFKEAWETILQENPFPAICGRVCYHPCEKACNRGELDEAVAVHTLERFLADTAARYHFTPDVERLPANGRKAAVAGSGPAGLAAAYFLSRLGYTCDVFEAASEPGGVLRWGIPAYRLPADILRGEIEGIRSAGVAIRCENPISRQFLEEAGSRSRYDAVFLGCGHWRGFRLGIEGEDLDGVMDGLQFLRKIRSDEEPPVLHGAAAVIGGGNTAIDAARSAIRLGASPLLIYRRTRRDIPAFEEEVRMALEEGVELRELVAPVRIVRVGNEYELTLQRMQVVGTGADGRSHVEPMPSELETLRVAHVFKAIGHGALEGWFDPPADLDGVMMLSQSALVHTEGKIPILYGGDLTTGIKSVVDAVASGKEAAMALDVFLKEGPDAVRPILDSCAVGAGPSLSMEIYMRGERCKRNRRVVTFGEINADHFQFASRIVQPRLLREERVRSFSEIDLRISASLAMREAERCFNCGLCNQCDNCQVFCPDLAVVRDASPRGRRIDYDYCKGCGVCIVECPRNAMSFEKD
jgi:NADPH-dependent glutamate synthase beta subunit-like oxidoreductase